MNNIQKTGSLHLDNKLIEDDFLTKVKDLDAQLKIGKMWMNVQCEMENKKPRFVRWIMGVLSFMLPINLFASIKVSRVALAYFKFVKTHEELLNGETIIDVKQVLITLKNITHKKYALKIDGYLEAIHGLAVKINDEFPKDKVIAEHLNELEEMERLDFFRKYHIKLPVGDDVKIIHPAPVKAHEKNEISDPMIIKN